MAKKVAPKPAKKAGPTAKAKTPVAAPKKSAAKPAVPAKKAAPAKPAPKAPAKKAPAPKPAPKKAAPAPKLASKPAPKPAPKPAAKPAPRSAPAKAAPAKAAPKSAPVKGAAVKSAGQKKLASQKTPGSAIPGKEGRFVQTAQTDARKLAMQKIQAKRNLSAPAQRPAPNVAAGLELSQPSGMYNGIVVTHDIKPFPLKTPYSKLELDELRATLLEERNRLLTQLASLQGVSMEALVSAKEHAGYSIHIAEHASDLQTAEANLGVRSIEEDRLEEVDSALDRIENNQRHFGLCMACGNKIGIQRLKARPHAHLCMPCRTRYETIRSRRGY